MNELIHIKHVKEMHDVFNIIVTILSFSKTRKLKLRVGTELAKYDTAKTVVSRIKPSSPRNI